jgi:hypothetical protein
MKGNSAVRIWRSFVVAAASSPRAVGGRQREDADENEATTPGPAVTRDPLAWDPYEVWLKRVKEPRDRRETSR